MTDTMLPAETLDTIRKFCAVFVPNAKVFLFGSYATKQAGLRSDIDIALQADIAISVSTLENLKTALAHSDIPQRVDIIDLQAVDPAFKQAIAAELLAV